MENKENQTALQQAFSELEKMHPGLFNIYSEDGRNFINHFHKFLLIEKHQIMEARNDGFLYSGKDCNGEFNLFDYKILSQEIKSEEYYIETYK